MALTMPPHPWRFPEAQAVSPTNSSRKGEPMDRREIINDMPETIDDCIEVYADGEPKDDSDCDHDFARGAMTHCRHCGMPWNGGVF